MTTCTIHKEEKKSHECGDHPGAKIATLKIFRGAKNGGSEVEYKVPVEEGMVVLDAVHYVQRNISPDLAVRWNCKAAKCGSCSAEVNGKPRLMCKSRLDDFDLSKEIRVHPMKSFPIIKDLACDVSWNYEVNKKITPFTPKENTDWRMSQRDIDRVQEFRKCIECFACQNVCHVIRDHDLKPKFAGPRFFVRVAGLEMHPLDNADRLEALKNDMGIGFCNITKCCTEVCPEDIHITDNAIIPLKERIVDRFYDPIRVLLNKLFRKR